MLEELDPMDEDEEIPEEEFDKILKSIIRDMTPSEILACGCGEVYDILAEEFKDQIMREYWSI